MTCKEPITTTFNMTIHEKHMQLIEAVNRSKTSTEHTATTDYLRGWRHGVEDVGLKIDFIAADLHYINLGVDRPMCGGLFLDWEPSV